MPGPVPRARAGPAGLGPRRAPWLRHPATGRLQVASSIAAGLADAGVASEPAALAYGLGFVPFAEERFDLVIPWARSARVRWTRC